MRKALVAAMALSLSACTTARLEPEINAFAAAVRTNVTRITPALGSGLAADRELALDEAAAFQDVWLLSDACADVLVARNSGDANACFIEKLTTDGSERSIGAATAVERRLGLLADYVDALALLADAGTEAGVTNAYAAAVASIGKLATASGSGSLTEFVAGLAENKPKSDAVVSFAIRTLRYNRLKSVVLASDSAVVEVVRSVQLGLIALNLDPQFTALAAQLGAANDAILLADAENDPADYRNRLVELDTAYAAFMSYRERSVYVQVGAIAAAHHSLAGALKTQSTDDVIDYLESLKTLAKVLEE